MSKKEMEIKEEVLTQIEIKNKNSNAIINFCKFSTWSSFSK